MVFTINVNRLGKVGIDTLQIFRGVKDGKLSQYLSSLSMELLLKIFQDGFCNSKTGKFDKTERMQLTMEGEVWSNISIVFSSFLNVVMCRQEAPVEWMKHGRKSLKTPTSG